MQGKNWRRTTLKAMATATVGAILISGCGGRPGIIQDGGVYGAKTAGSGVKRPRDHEGTDYRTHRGTVVVAPGDGTVMKAVAKITRKARNRRWNCDHELRIKHNGRTQGFSTRYCHLGKLYVGFGDEVKEGQKIATVGQCGKGPPQCSDHLHVEVVQDWIRQDPEKKIGGCYSEGEAVLSEERPLYHPLEC